MKAGLAIWGRGVRRPKYFTIYYRSTRSLQGNMRISLLCRHNGHNGFSNHQSRDCLLNRSFRCRSKKTSDLCVTGLLRGIHRWPSNKHAAWFVRGRRRDRVIGLKQLCEFYILVIQLQSQIQHKSFLMWSISASLQSLCPWLAQPLYKDCAMTPVLRLYP